MSPTNPRAVALTALLLAWGATAYRLPHHKWKSAEGGEDVAGAKPVSDDALEATADSALEATTDSEELENTEAAKVFAAQAPESMKEHDSETSINDHAKAFGKKFYVYYNKGANKGKAVAELEKFAAEDYVEHFVDFAVTHHAKYGAGEKARRKFAVEAAKALKAGKKLLH